MTIAQVSSFATKASTMLNTRILRQKPLDPLLLLVQSLLIRQIGLSDQIAAKIRDGKDFSADWDLLNLLGRQAVDACKILKG